MAKKNIETEVRRAVLIWTKNQFKEQIETQIEKGKEVFNFDIPSHFVSVGYGYGQGARKVYDVRKYQHLNHYWHNCRLFNVNMRKPKMSLSRSQRKFL